MRVIVLGTGGFAVPSFKRIIEAGHEVIALMALPLRSATGQKHIITPMRVVAQQYNIPILEPPDINSQEAADLIYLMAADILFVCDFGRILSDNVLSKTRMGGLNLHGSLLPKYRGAAPINRAILNGEPKTGVTVIHMMATVDAGPIVAQSLEMSIEDTDDAVEVEKKLSNLGSWLIVQTLLHMETGRLPAIPQNIDEITKAPKLRKEEAVLDWTRGAQFVHNHVRAMVPWPKTLTFWKNPSGKVLRLIIDKVDVVDPPLGVPQSVEPGTVVSTNEELLIATPNRFVRILAIRPSGKAVMNAVSFVNGYRIKPGDLLGPENVVSAR